MQAVLVYDFGGWGHGAKRYRDERFAGGLAVFRRGFSGIADRGRGGEAQSTSVESLNE
jgi:hypothetical protein